MASSRTVKARKQPLSLATRCTPVERDRVSEAHRFDKGFSNMEVKYGGHMRNSVHAEYHTTLSTHVSHSRKACPASRPGWASRSARSPSALQLFLGSPPRSNGRVCRSFRAAIDARQMHAPHVCHYFRHTDCSLYVRQSAHSWIK